MTALWKCPDPDCPPTEIAPKEVEERGDASAAAGQILSLHELADLLKVPINTIYKWNRDGNGPPHYRAAGRIFYRNGEVLRWLAERPADPSTDVMPRGSEDRLLTTDEVAEWLGVPVSTLYWWRSEGKAPPGFRVGKYVRYQRTDVLRWLAEQGLELATCGSECGRTYARSAFTQAPGNA
jgi:excisionase family DNA binding protein